MSTHRVLSWGWLWERLRGMYAAQNNPDGYEGVDLDLEASDDWDQGDDGGGDNDSGGDDGSDGDSGGGDFD